MLNREGLDIIKEAEGLSLKAYPDPYSDLGKELRKKRIKLAQYKLLPEWDKLDGSPWTIGYGTTFGVFEGMEITLEQAEEFLNRDVLDTEMSMKRLIKVALNSNQYSALGSFFYNLGFTKDVKNSTLLKLLNKSRFDKVADEFLRWVKAQGETSPGLIKRRRKERALFLKPEAATLVKST